MKPFAAAYQRGAALLAAMLTVTLVATLAAAALWQQWRSVEVEAAERSRVQATWMLTGALDWARLILREDARSGGADHLAEPWAVPLQEARLSTFLAADRNNPGSDSSDPQEAFLSGQITDLQSRLNLLNLVENNKLSEPALRSFAKLFALLGLPPQQLEALSSNLRLALDSSAAGSAPLLPQRVEQQTVLGLSPRSVALLRPYVTLLPSRTPVNLNTASPEVLYASIAPLDMAHAQRLVGERERAHFRTLADAARLIAAKDEALNDSQHAIASRYFEVRARLRLEQTVVEERAVLQRDGLEVKTLSRERELGELAARAAPLQR